MVPHAAVVPTGACVVLQLPGVRVIGHLAHAATAFLIPGHSTSVSHAPYIRTASPLAPRQLAPYAKYLPCLKNPDYRAAVEAFLSGTTLRTCAKIDHLTTSIDEIRTTCLV